MKNTIVSLLVLGLAGAMLVASPAEANDKNQSKTVSSKLARPCRNVKVAMISRTCENNKAANPERTEPYFNSDYASQHPSGG